MGLQEWSRGYQLPGGQSDPAGLKLSGSSSVAGMLLTLLIGHESVQVELDQDDRDASSSNVARCGGAGTMGLGHLWWNDYVYWTKEDTAGPDDGTM
jgi:hypothetical protein